TSKQDGKLVTNGGRVLGVTALGVSGQQARERAYAVVDAGELGGKQCRRGIGARPRSYIGSPMGPIAGCRCGLWDASKVQLGGVVASPVTDVKERLASGELVRDSSPAMYRYHQIFEHGGRTVTRQTLVCAVRLEPWTDGQIRPHEQTDPTAREA